MSTAAMNTLQKTAFVVLIFVLLLPKHGSGVTMNNTKRLQDKLLTDYYKDVRPVVNQASTVYVTIFFNLISIASLDEVTGTLTFVGMFMFLWKDESMVWDPAMYGGASGVSISLGKVWSPELALLSAADEIRFVGRDEGYKIRYFANGYAMHWPFERVESSCPVNVRKYPFDVQYCVIVFTTIGYLENELELVVTNNTANMQYYINNSVWDVLSTKIEVVEPTVITLTFELKRKSEFIVLNVLLPITLLGLLNVLVFLLVPDSGERISYCITVLLAISVFMTIISDTLPKSSDPVPVISYKLMVDVIISMLISVVTILNLRLHYKDEEKHVPQCLQSMYRFFCCKSCKTRKRVYKEERGNTEEYFQANRVHLANGPRQGAVISPYEIRHDIPTAKLKRPRVDSNSDGDDEPEEEKKVTWKNIAAMIDAFAFIFFTLAIITSFVIFIVYTTVIH